MSKNKKKVNCLDPFNIFSGIAGAAAVGLFAKRKVKRDYEKGCGDESAAAAMTLFGIGSMKRGGEGIMNLGGVIGVNGALKDVKKKELSDDLHSSRHYDATSGNSAESSYFVKSGLWREHCEDGSAYGISPYDYKNADDYEDALREAKLSKATQTQGTNVFVEDDNEKVKPSVRQGNQYRWRLHCEDGSKYGIFPEDYETADDYEEAIENAKKLQKDERA